MLLPTAVVRETLRTARRLRIGAAAILFAAAAAPLAAQPVTVGTVTAAPGSRASGWLDVAPRSDSGTRIPITVVRGRAPGPTLALVAGTQGGKVAPVVALQRLRQTLDPGTLRGTVILVHVANVPSFLSRMPYRSPVDGKNGNRVYPGRALYLQTLAHLLGKPALTTMVGGGGVADSAAVRLNVEGAERVLRHLGMVPGRAAYAARPVFLTRMDVVGSPGTGTWRRAVEAGQRVKRGEPLGRIDDFFGEPLHEVSAPFDGVVLYVTVGPAISAGEPLLLLGGSDGRP